MLKGEQVLDEIKAHFIKEKKILRRLRKLSDPGVFAISYSIFDVRFDNSNCDSGSSVNIMPLKIAKGLKISFQASMHTLKYADASSSKLEGFLADILVHIEHFLIPMDFHIVEMARNSNEPFILGIAFLNTIRAYASIGAFGTDW